MAWQMTRLAIRRAGGRCRRITAATPDIKQQLDGLVIGGGSDIDPSHYGDELRQFSESAEEQSLKDRLIGLVLFLIRGLFSTKRRSSRRDPERDILEKDLCRFAVDNRIPILGICRGAQMINVAQGGSLHQATGQFYTETPHVRTIMPRRTIELEVGTLLAGILGPGRHRVNALHDQAVDRLGDHLQVSAQDANGIVQAIEHRNHPFAIGVQWHPEYLPQIASQQRLFRTLVDRAEERRATGRRRDTETSRQ
ncbi:MAG: gamma-glutamyl-gamma-aminobutyrate hydrolase [Porticoccaceae bacterium]|nr:gamma-glutamyl-gamma-aminobutyrate hydrolase [Porticoccaceae bacterium]